jgi:hypothetical protein
MRQTNRLTQLAITHLNKIGRYSDGGGLYLQVSKWGTKAWVFRYRLRGRDHTMGLGALADFTLAEARARARRLRQQLADRQDPLELRRADEHAARAAAGRLVTFRTAAERYIKAQEPGWRNEKHAAQWTATLETYAYPVIGDISVDAVDTAHVVRILEPIWTTRTETASRVRGRIEAILDWAAVNNYRAGDNPARWRGHLAKHFPEKTKVRRVRHMPAMPYREVPGFMAELRARNIVSAWCLEFTVLTACRTGDAIGARWTEIANHQDEGWV